MEKKPCPFCGGTNLELRHKINQGHGDCTFSDLRVVCLNTDCEATRGLSDYGRPGLGANTKAIEVWNKRIN